MTLSLDEAAAEALLRGMTLGLARQPVALESVFGGIVPTEDPKAMLKALALLGQRQRFRRPEIASPAPEAALFPDTRPILPEAARPALLSLLTGKSGQAGDPIAQAIADLLAARGRRLHPFDLPRLDSFVRAQAEKLGPSAIAWAERQNTAEPDRGASLFFDSLDASNWTLGRPAQRAGFIRALRATDPGHARDVVESVFAVEPAPVRVVLLSALRENLSPADGPFLETLAKDRAPSVREAAEKLLEYLPGSAAAAKRLTECLGRLKAGRKGLLRRRTTLTLDLPANIKPQQAEAWAHGAFAGLTLDALAQGLELAADDLVEAAAEDAVLTQVLAGLASAERRYDLLDRFVQGGAETVWQHIVRDGAPLFADGAAAQAWSAVAIRPALWVQMPMPAWLERLYGALRCPLPEPILRELFGAKAWRDWVEAMSKPDTPAHWAAGIVALGALTPPPLRLTLRNALAALPPEQTARTLTALALFDRIDAA
jgi:hypothetical protein